MPCFCLIPVWEMLNGKPEHEVVDEKKKKFSSILRLARNKKIGGLICSQNTKIIVPGTFCKKILFIYKNKEIKRERMMYRYFLTGSLLSCKVQCLFEIRLYKAAK